MKITFTFEYADLLVQIQKQLEMNGLQVLKDDDGAPQIRFSQKSKQVIVECEQGELSSACPFCNAAVNRGVAQSTKNDELNNRNDKAPSAEPDIDVDEEPLTVGAISQLRAQSERIASERARNGEGFRPRRLMPGESEEPPFGGR